MNIQMTLKSNCVTFNKDWREHEGGKGMKTQKKKVKFAHPPLIKKSLNEILTEATVKS